jgi:uncharacterized RDD family membrane protein YckC
LSTDLSSFLFDPLPIADTVPQTRSIGGFWRRFLAFVVDGLILYLVGRTIGAALFNTLSQMGPWGMLVGFCIALVYFALLDSRIGNGQTVGKRLLKLRVVDTQGNAISFWKSLARYTVFAAPHFISKLGLPASRTPWIVPFVIFIVAVGVGGSTLYLLIFNRHTRQGLHDLIVGSYVVKTGNTGPVETEPIWDMHWRVLRWLLTLLLFLSLSIGIMGYKLENSGPVSQRQQDLKLIEQLDRVQVARVQNFKPLRWSGFMPKNPLATKHALVITVWWTGESGGREAFADRVAKLTLQNDPKVQDQDMLRIVIARGYYLGIASGGDSQTFTHTPTEWSQRVLVASPAQSSTPAQKEPRGKQ